MTLFAKSPPFSSDELNAVPPTMPPPCPVAVCAALRLIFLLTTPARPPDIKPPEAPSAPLAPLVPEALREPRPPNPANPPPPKSFLPSVIPLVAIIASASMEPPV